MNGRTIDPTTAHLCQPEHAGLPGGMRDLYGLARVYPTSTLGDTMLIRSHIAYHSGSHNAERATIRPTRGHRYRVTLYPYAVVVGITNPDDHRAGVVGWCS